jgi:dTDP-4-amino-4,6-dideoxygalactose transaminase
VSEPATLTKVPFLDLRVLHADLKEDVLAAMSELIDRAEFGSAVAVREFEDAFAAFCGVSWCVALSSGLDGIRFLLEAVGVERGDEVIVPAMTFVATYEAISQVGATPVPVDVTSGDYCIDWAEVEAAITPRTRVLLPVHLYGQLADMAQLRAIAERHGLTVVEDACQAHGAARAGAGSGHETAGAAFSFYPSKNLGAMGDAGAVVTDDEHVADRVRMLREHGQREKHRHEVVGWTGRMDAFQAAVLARKLPRLAEWNAQRRQVAAAYAELLAGIGDLALPAVAADSEHVWHLYVVRTADPESLADHLRRQRIATGRHYPTIPPLTEAYADLGLAPGAFPRAEELARTGLSLPIFPGMTESQIDAVAAAIADYFLHG